MGPSKWYFGMSLLGSPYLWKLPSVLGKKAAWGFRGAGVEGGEVAG